MIGLSAEIFNIPDRGRIASGCVADLVAFDAQRISDDLNYSDPVRYPAGIHWVMQQGEVVVKDGAYLRKRRGKRLKPAVRART